MPLLRPGAPPPADLVITPLTPKPRHPDPLDLRELLGNLLDRDVTVTVSATGEARCDAYLTAAYEAADGTTVVLSSTDIELTAGLGASLALIPADTAKRWVEDGALTADAIDNAAEVLNILAQSLNVVNTRRHVRMVDKWLPGDEAARRLDGVRQAISYAVSIDGFPSGVLALQSR